MRRTGFGGLLGRMTALLRRGPDAVPAPGSWRRPVGNHRPFLEDLAARGWRPGEVLDVGANRAQWSRLVAAIFTGARFTLVEPQAEMRADLAAFCSAHPGSRHIEAGAAAAMGERVLTLWDDLEGSSCLPTPEAALESSGKQRRIPVITLDSLVEQSGGRVPELVKLDVQGFELEVLKGAGSLLGRTEMFVLETSLFRFLPGQPLFHEVVGFMAERGYLVYDFPGFLRRPLDGALGQVDVAFVRQGATLRGGDGW